MLKMDIPTLERYSKDSRLTLPSDGKKYNFRKMIDTSKSLGRPLTNTEAEKFRLR